MNEAEGTSRAVPAYLRQVQTFLTARDSENRHKRTREQSRDWLKKFLQAEGYTDGSGHQCFDFEQPLVIGGTRYTGLQNRRNQGKPVLDEDKAFDLLFDKHLNERAIVHVEYDEVDQNELAVLNQEGLITDDELDSLMIRPEPTYSLFPVEE